MMGEAPNKIPERVFTINANEYIAVNRQTIQKIADFLIQDLLFFATESNNKPVDPEINNTPKYIGLIFPINK